MESKSKIQKPKLVNPNKLYKRKSVGKIIADSCILALIIVVYYFVFAGFYENVTGKDALKPIGVNVFIITSESMSCVHEANEETLADKKAGFVDIGDIVVTVRTSAEKLNRYDLVVYRDYSGNMVFHRIWEIRDSKNGQVFVLRGDANNTNDPYPVYYEKIKGKYLFCLKGMGEIVGFIKSGYGVMAFFTIVLIILVQEYIKECSKD